MTGDEAKALIVSIFGEKAPTRRAATALGMGERALQRLYRRKKISRRDEFALMELRRRHRLRSHADSRAEVEAEIGRFPVNPSPSTEA